jgi:DNA-binding NarL/FixJ family response regulator
MRQGLRQILEHEADFAIVAEAESGLQAQQHQPDVTAVGIAMKELNTKNSAGDELIEAVREVEKGANYFSPAVAKAFRNGYLDLQLGYPHRHQRGARDLRIRSNG